MVLLSDVASWIFQQAISTCAILCPELMQRPFEMHTMCFIKMCCWICRRSCAVSRHALKVKFWVFLFTCWMRLQWYSVPKRDFGPELCKSCFFFLIAITICCSFAFGFPITLDLHAWFFCLLMRNNTALYLWLSVECVETLNPVIASFKISNKAFVKKKNRACFVVPHFIEIVR